MGCQCSRRTAAPSAKVADGDEEAGLEEKPQTKDTGHSGDEHESNEVKVLVHPPAEENVNSCENCEPSASEPQTSESQDQPLTRLSTPEPLSTPSSPRPAGTGNRRPSLASHASSSSSFSHASITSRGSNKSREKGVTYQVCEGVVEEPEAADEEEVSPASSQKEPPSPRSPVSPGSQGDFGRRSHSKFSVQSAGSNVSGRSKSQGGRSQPPSPTPEVASAVPETQDAVAEQLSKAILHSGSLVQHSVRVRALQAFDNLTEACKGHPKPDQHMPNFEMKVDPENLLSQIPADIFKPGLLVLQRVSFMNTKWIALRLARGSREQCLRFCLCAGALQNMGKNSSRSVVIEAMNPKDAHEEVADIPSFLCSAIPSREHLMNGLWLDALTDISELAEIITNDSGVPDRKVQLELKKWTMKRRDKNSATCKSRWAQASVSPDSAASPSRRRSHSDVGLQHSALESDASGPQRRRSSSVSDIEVNPEPVHQGPFSSAAKWIRDRLSLRVFNSLEEQMNSLTPSSPRNKQSRGRSSSKGSSSTMGAGESRGSSKSGSRSRHSSSKHAQKSDNGGSRQSGSKESNSRRSDSKRRKSSRDSSKEVSSSDDDEDADDRQQRQSTLTNVSDSDQPSSPCSPSSKGRRKSVARLDVMPVVHELGAEAAEEPCRSSEFSPAEDPPPDESKQSHSARLEPVAGEAAELKD
eukprot:TRINITY_DN62726_c0_g1_i1.p1 TRINITY_DN62726_c0_g1~~TRINITY_DN62726_c0_g1_i1.p1  ORF type:complete len:696 (-),score=112.76 TRINITY_DN62726_c0_g1_i1:100-2187(-)